MGALGGVISEIAAGMMRDAGVDLRTGFAVQGLEGDAGTSVGPISPMAPSSRSTWWWPRWGRSATWSGSTAPAAAGQWGLACDAGCRAFDINGVVTDHIFVAGDVARAPHVLYDYEFLSQEHWDNAVFGAQVAANNMLHLEVGRRPHLPLPSFWSGQFGVNIKSVGVCSYGDEIVFTQARPAIGVSPPRTASAAASSARSPSTTASGCPTTPSLIEVGAVPAPPPGYDRPSDAEVMPARFPDPREPSATRTWCSPDTTPPTAAPNSGRALKETHVMDAATAWAEAMKFENRPNPYPYYEELRKTPVAKVSEKTYVVTGYPEAVALAHDPRISSDISRSPSGMFGEKEVHLEPTEAAQGRDLSMLVSDPPEHDRMRRQFMRHFGPPHTRT